MLGSLRLVDPKAAGTQTLRLLTALVVSLGVTGAVTGPLAYRAMEFRQAVTDQLAVSPAPEAGPQGPGLGQQGGDPASNSAVSDTVPGSSSTAPSPGAATAGPSVGPLQGHQAVEGQPSSATTGAAGTAGTGDNAALPATISRPTATTAAAPSAPPSAPSTPPSGTTVPAAVTTTTRNPLDEFNPRPSCDDKAQELNAADQLTCASTPSGP